MRIARLGVLTAALFVVVAGCSGDDNADPATTPAIPGDTTTPSSSASSTDAPSTSAEPSSTITPTTTTTQAPSTSPTTMPPTTSTAPASTLIPPAALETDPSSPNNTRVVTADQQPIIDAYRAAADAQFVALSRWPLDPLAPELVNGPFTERLLDVIESGIAERAALNQVLDISGGLTLRPYVVDDDDGDPNRVFVWDCQIDATYWKDVDTGEKAPPDAFPNVGPPGVEVGVVAVLVNVDGEWLVDDGGLEPQACV